MLKMSLGSGFSRLWSWALPSPNNSVENWWLGRHVFCVRGCGSHTIAGAGSSLAVSMTFVDNHV